MDFRLLFVSSLALLVACFDDTPSGDGTGTGTGTAGPTDGGPSTADGGPSTADDGGSTLPQDGSGSSGSTGPSDSTATGSSSDDGVSSEDTAGSTDTGGTDTGSSSGSGSSGDGSTGDSGDSGTTAACQPITDDASAIGQQCKADGDCPDGYTCQGFSGIVFQQNCQILCEQACECPGDLSCVQVVDKSMMPWMQCSL